MLVANTRARWFVCFVALPALWIAFSVETGWHAVLMIPAAVLVAVVSALIAYGSGLGGGSAVGYFIGTAVMMGVAFFIAVATLFTIYCGGDDTSDC